MSTTTLSVPCCVGARISVRRRGRVKAIPPRAALVEAKPRPAQAVNGGDGSASVALLRVRDSSSSAPSSRDRADDMQAEARAMARAANASVYSPELLATKYGSRPIKVVRRALEIFAGIGYFAFNLWLDQVKGQLDQNQRQRAVQLRTTLTRLGPTFVKIGQGLSTRPDLCPPQYLEELSQLQMQKHFHALKESWDVHLILFTQQYPHLRLLQPVLGQVYKAQLKYSGQVVAVKVQRPGIEEAIGLDFYLIRGLGFLINKYVDIISSDVVALIDEFARRVYQELNYVQEGQNARRFKKLYADKEDVLVPDIFWDYTSGKVLTMEWVEGVKLNEQEAIERQGLKVLDLVNTGIQCSLRQLLEYGYFHADPHPGNLLATPDGKLAFLDFGMMSETPEQARSAIIGHVVHMVNRDYEAMARDYYALDFFS
ncbi:UNVERIFIED_CONTAM: protein ACTIVITY OF BC1 COMPLEX kinase, chloroplastic [Sesamum radiatum]|uniref:Protein ACTIVITY OF BC1 COMPLEX kinase, chloroplastic n=1 Tax=Sesamum radiatum TaxID=300843 RepID=A0AAW2W681_SESRA